MSVGRSKIINVIRKPRGRRVTERVGVPVGLLISIYRDGYDSSLNVFQRKRQVTLTNVSGPFEPTADAPAALLIAGHSTKSAIIVPADEYTDGVQMFGGTYGATSDSRFSEAVKALCGTSHFAVAIHDRRETWADYERYSN
jgi:hypothetical protein